MYNKCLKDPVGLPMIEDEIVYEMEKIDLETDEYDLWWEENNEEIEQ